MRWLRISLVGAAVVGLAGCAPYSCGWDDAIERSSSYRVTLGEAYGPASTTARYSVAEDFPFRPVPSCGTIDEFVSGAVFDVVRQGASHATSDTCSQWPMTVTSPTLSSIGVSQDLLNTPLNLLRLGLARDFGGGCVASWELTVHSPGDDPFAVQSPSALPVVLGYRALRAPPGAASAACATLVGAATPSSGAFICGDIFVATMTTL